MTTLRTDAYTLPAAEIGPENPLPMFRGPEDNSPMGLDESVPEDDRRYMGWMTGWRVLPHRLQDEYSRRRQVRALDALVIENEFLKATFLPNVGGKLASLIHKPVGRELLHRNPVFQPANLALRNAWTSGGIEWNSVQPGHHYLTCSPVFCAQVTGPDGTPCLRIYEWDRVKGFFWQVDFWLPSDSQFLYARTRIVNPHPYEIAMYWWTNMAVDEREDVRVLVPAETALCHRYTGKLEVAPLPRVDSRDLTYSTQSPHSADFFSRIPEGRRRWIAALGADGTGFFETSTDRLRGRKLFCWGMGSGGRRWQEYLAAAGCAYIEIQAGLTRTQMECLPMPPETEWTWTEAFGYLEADPTRVHSDDWHAAWSEAGRRIDQALPASRLEDVDRRLSAVAVTPPERILRYGSGWGALERERRRHEGQPDFVPAGLEFPASSLGDDQEPWLTLLKSGYLPLRDPVDGPGALMTQPEWAELMKRSTAHPDGDHWLDWWHLGNLLMEARDLDAAKRAWLTSLERRRTGWALRNLAVLAERRGCADEALEFRRQAWEAGPRIAPLAIEYANALVAATAYKEALAFLESLPDAIRSHERLLILWAKAAIETDHLEGVESLFDHEFATVREGEVTLTDLWFTYHERRLAAQEGVASNDGLRERVRAMYPPPARIDFRMAAASDAALAKGSNSQGSDARTKETD